MITKILIILLLITNINTILGFNINNWFEHINKDYLKYNAEAADIVWQSSLDPKFPEKAEEFEKRHLTWQHKTCDELATLYKSHSLNMTQKRQAFLLCRGPKYNFDESRKASRLIEDMQNIYSNAKLCIPNTNASIKNNIKEIEKSISEYIAKTRQYLQLKINLIDDPVKIAMNNAIYIYNDKNLYCLHGEKDFDDLVTYSDDPDVLKLLWLSWREILGPYLKAPFRELVVIENKAAKRNGYSDIGEWWRLDPETEDLRQLCWELYDSIKPLYQMVHGVARYYLRSLYGDIVPQRGLIPAHLIGNLWSSNWENLANKMVPNYFDINKSIQEQRLNITLMVKKTEDFFRSLGLPKLPESFWRNSVFTRVSKDMRCHGTAADMFKEDDYRLLYCGSDKGVSQEDFYILHHELGHVYYFMAYSGQPGIFRQGANSVFHESIGDTIMNSVMSPQHLHRLKLINDSTLFNNQGELQLNPTDGAEMLSFDEIFLVKQIFNKLPQIPFALALEEYRWKYFEGSLDEDRLNNEYWDLVAALQGIAPPVERNEKYFDVGAKFHVPDNTPYARYFLSSFLQHQLFEHLCKVAVYGRKYPTDELPPNFIIHRCDLYGSMITGKVLKDLMSRGSSQTWKEILKSTTGDDEITSKSLQRYYRPLYKVLSGLITKYDIPVGW